MKRRIITLITDFGVSDEYSGVMKGVILSINPDCLIIDITHQITPMDIREASFILNNTYPYFPSGTIHIVVVDPGVGSLRRPLLLIANGHFFVGPDNGVFTTILMKDDQRKIYELTNKMYFLPTLTSTFQGRDLFAPVAAHLSLDLNPEDLGQEISDPITLPDFTPQVSNNQIEGKVIHIDRFGNLITNIQQNLFTSFTKGKKFSIQIASLSLERITLAYHEGKEDEPLALFGSSGWLEISVNKGSAKNLLEVEKGEIVRVIVF